MNAQNFTFELTKLFPEKLISIGSQQSVISLNVGSKEFNENNSLNDLYDKCDAKIRRSTETHTFFYFAKPPKPKAPISASAPPRRQGKFWDKIRSKK
jgi:hypothetical protein